MRDSSKNQVDIVFIRHGKTKGNLEGRYIGRTNEGLCKEGREEIAAKHYPRVQRVFISPMLRCIETAGIIYPDIEAVEIEEFKEMDFGDFEGKNYKELNGNSDYQRWIDEGGTGAFPNGEERGAFIKRVNKGFKKVCEIIKKENLSKVALVVHGGTVMAILSELSGGDYFDYQIKNGEIYECSITL